MKFTKWFNFKKPDPLDTVNINDLNDSFDMIDEKLKETEEENKNLLSKFKALIINAGNSNAEVVDARVAKSGSRFEKLGDRLDNFDSHLAEKTDKAITNNIQGQIDNLVLGAVGNGNNAEVVQARGKYKLLNTRFEVNENNFKNITIKIESKNIYNFNSDFNINGKFINYDGSEVVNENSKITHFIDVKAGDIVRFIKNPYTSNNYGAVYTENDVFIKKLAIFSPVETSISIDNHKKTLVTFTIPSSESTVRKLKLNLEPSSDNIYNMVTINKDMPNTFDKYVNEYKLNGEKIINQTHISSLTSKTALFNGDSICNGITGILPSEPTYGFGWAGRIGTRNNMTWKNYGVAGGTVCSDTYNWTWISDTSNLDWTKNTYYKRIGSSASGTDTMYQIITQNEWDGVRDLYLKGNARHWESKGIDEMYAEYPNADYVILEACLNDGFNGVPKGTLSDSYDDDFKTTTFTSAFEYMLKRTITLFPNAKIGVIIPHRPKGNISEHQDIARKVCEKWSIPYLDLYKNSGLCVNNLQQKAVMFVDDTHLSTKGYDFITIKIEEWMKSL